jgi:hypothetical protein
MDDFGRVYKERLMEYVSMQDEGRADADLDVEYSGILRTCGGTSAERCGQWAKKW